MATQPRGILIAFEGIDGAGKTTQVGLLEEFFQSIGEDVVRSKEPTDGPWGKKIRASATTGRMPVAEELAAFVEDRKEHVRDVIQPALDAGKIVILDRYFYSTIAYQGVRGADVTEVTRQMLGQFPIPDVVLLIDAPTEVGVSRVRDGRREVPNAFEQTDALRRSREAFMAMAATHSNIVTVNGTVGIQWVRWSIINNLLEGVLKARHCAKSYGCDDPALCAARMSGECRWFKMCRVATRFSPD